MLLLSMGDLQSCSRIKNCTRCHLCWSCPLPITPRYIACPILKRVMISFPVHSLVQLLPKAGKRCVRTGSSMKRTHQRRYELVSRRQTFLSRVWRRDTRYESALSCSNMGLWLLSSHGLIPMQHGLGMRPRVYYRPLRIAAVFYLVSQKSSSSIYKNIVLTNWTIAVFITPSLLV